MEEGRDRGLDVIQRMDLDASLALVLPIQRPLECLKAKLGGR